MRLNDRRDVVALKQDMHATFDTEHGKRTLEFIEKLGSWYPMYSDSMDTNSIISRDATRRLIGTIKTILTLSPEQIVMLGERMKDDGLL